MNAMFENYALDMLALESAVDFFETENGLTESYLRSNVQYDNYEAATESAFDDVDDGIFAGIFTDLPATEAAEGKKDSFGAKLGRGIKSILGAIGNFFKGLGAKVSGAAKTMKNKISAAKAKGTSHPMENDVIAAAKDVRAAVKTALGILTQGLESDASKMSTICGKINAAVNKAKSHSGSLKNSDAIDETAERIGRSYRTDSSELGEKSREDASREVDEAESTLKSIQETEKRLNEACEIVATKYNAILKKVLDAAGKEAINDHMKENSEFEQGVTESDEDWEKRSEKMLNEKRDRSMQNGLTKEELDEYKKVGKGDRKGLKRSTLTASAVRTILVKDYLVDDNELLGKITKAVDKVVNVCSQNEKFCTAVAANADNIKTDNPDAKIGYRLCKIYSAASKSFSVISARINSFWNGGIFTGTKAGESDLSINTRDNKDAD